MSAIAITLDDISIVHRNVEAISHLSASFHPGTITALVGGDGAGKTSLLAALANPTTRKQLAGSSTNSLLVGYQSRQGGVWDELSVAENLEFATRAYRLQRTEAKRRSRELLGLANLAEASNRPAGHLSGGMRQKLGCIMAILPRPQLLLLDEPTTGVDGQSRATIWQLMRQAASEGSIVIAATTYLDEAHDADQVIVLSHGSALAKGSPTDVIAHAPGVVSTARSAPGDDIDPDPRVWRRAECLYTWHPEAEDASNTPADMDLELATIALLLAEGVTKPTPLPPIAANYQRGQTLLAVQAVHKTYGELSVLDNIDLQLKSGEIVGLVGENGAGKSTLIRLILGLDQPCAGRIELFGQPPGRKARAQIGYVPQSLGLYPALSARANFNFTASIFGASTPPAALDPHTPTGELPLGEQRNLAVICALCHAPRLLILDEPTSGMDVLSRANVWKALRRAAQSGVGILITTHYQDEARQCDRIIHLHEGTIVSPN